MPQFARTIFKQRYPVTVAAMFVGLRSQWGLIVQLTKRSIALCYKGSAVGVRNGTTTYLHRIIDTVIFKVLSLEERMATEHINLDIKASLYPALCY